MRACYEWPSMMAITPFQPYSRTIAARCSGGEIGRNPSGHEFWYPDSCEASLLQMGLITGAWLSDQYLTVGLVEKAIEQRFLRKRLQGADISGSLTGKDYPHVSNCPTCQNFSLSIWLFKNRCEWICPYLM